MFGRHGGAAAKTSSTKAREGPGMSFIMLSESQIGPPDGSEHKSPAKAPLSIGKGQNDTSAAEREETSTTGFNIDKAEKLWEIISARSDVDHPICVECTELLVEGLQKRLESTLKERDAFGNLLKQLQTDQPTDQDLRAQEEALRKAQKDEAAALEELRTLEREKAALDDEMLALEDESRQLDHDEEQFWRERNAFATRLTEFQNERDSINSRFDHDSKLLEKLQRSNVYNDTFTISHDGTFATINGLRLGRYANNPVDWPEINAAWGHALLLLVTVADKLNYKFDGFEPQPMGSTSRIIRYDLSPAGSSRLGSHRGGPPPAPKKHVLDLFSSGDMPLGLTFMHRKFDQAMTAFLELVRQLGVFVQRQTAEQGDALSLPYRIDGDKIGDVSIKLGIAQDDGWTKACKLTLTCCKFLLAHASNVSAMSNGRGTTS
jgi:beclin